MQPLHITQANKDFADLRTELGIEAGTNLTVGKIEKVMKKKENKHLRLKCFFLVLISKFLMPTTTQFININAVKYTKDMNVIGDFDCCTVVYEQFRTSVSTLVQTHTVQAAENSFLLAFFSTACAGGQ